MFDLLQLLGGIILAIGYIPQIAQLVKTRSSGDLNLKLMFTCPPGFF